MNKSDYHNKILELLDDRNTYEKINRDLTNKIQNKNNEIVKRWHNRNYIDNNQNYSLLGFNAVAPKFYGLPKIHKDN